MLTTQGDAVKKPRKQRLRVYNGTLMFHMPNHKQAAQLEVSLCAYSQKDAVALLAEHEHPTTLHEFRGYWNDCWGNSMDGIERERGIWVEYENDIPIRIEILKAGGLIR